MESLKSSFVPSFLLIAPPKNTKLKPPSPAIFCCISPDPWSLSSGNSKNLNKTKPKSKKPKTRSSDDDVPRIIKGKTQYLRRNQGSGAETPKWVRRTPEQMVRYLEDDRNGHLYGRHVVAAIKRVRSTSEMAEGEYDMRAVMASFVAKLSFREMCVVLKEQKSWRQVRDFFAWMKLQLCYRPSVVVYTLVLRAYGQFGKIKLAEEAFLEMLEEGCQPDEVACGTMLWSYARWGRHKSMLSFYSAVEDRGIIPPSTVFNFMLSSLQKKSLHSEVLYVWIRMVDKGVTRNHFSYTVVINSLVKGGRVEEALKTFYEMKNLGFVPEESTYSLLISSSSKAGDKDEARRLYEDMRSHGIVPSNFTCASLIALYCRTSDYAQAYSLFTEMEKHGVIADEVIYGLLIRIYGKVGLYEDAEKTFLQISRSGRLVDEKTYTTMAQVHLSYGNVDKALDVMELMKSNSVPHSKFSYLILSQCYTLKGDLASVEVVYETLSESGIVDSACCKDLLDLYLGRGLSEKAKAFVAQIRKNKFEFDEELFIKVMTVYCKEGMLREVKQLLDELRVDLEAVPCFRTFFIAINEQLSRLAEPSDRYGAVSLELILTLFITTQNEAKINERLVLFLQSEIGQSVANRMVIKFANEGDILSMEHLYKLMMKHGCGLDDTTCAAMITLYGKEKKVREAQEIFAGVGCSAPNGNAMYSSMISAYITCGREVEALVLYREQTRKGQRLDPFSISKLVKAFTTSGKYLEAGEVIRSCFHENLELDTVAYNTCISAMMKAGKLRFAVSIFERMLSLNISPSLQTYNTMISVYGRNRNLDKAVEMFNMARSLDEGLDERTCTNMIFHYGKAGKVDEASTLYNNMQEEGIRPEQVCHNIMLNLYATKGMHEEAENLLFKLHENGYSPDSLKHTHRD